MLIKVLSLSICFQRNQKTILIGVRRVFLRLLSKLWLFCAKRKIKQVIKLIRHLKKVFIFVSEDTEVTFWVPRKMGTGITAFCRVNNNWQGIAVKRKLFDRLLQRLLFYSKDNTTVKMKGWKFVNAKNGKAVFQKVQMFWNLTTMKFP